MLSLALFIPICAAMTLVVVALLARNPIRIDAAAYDQAVKAAQARAAASTARLPL